MPVKKTTRENMPLYFFIALLTLVSACGLLGGDDKEPLEPGPRNYEWRVIPLSLPLQLLCRNSLSGSRTLNQPIPNES